MEDSQHSEVAKRVRKIRHDANSPLTASLGHVQLLLDDPAAQHPEVQESLKVVENELERLISILAELKDIK